ncbi:MAG TPA: hypothetical protein VFG79_08155 [Solirubrobacter sp.]|nr:hypothetical protein [Solirubrobacter sp.]
MLLAAALVAALFAPATVRSVVDGDTIRIRQDGRAKTVNLRGVDAPTGAECHAAEATQALRRLLKRGARITTHGRYVRRRGRLINAVLIRRGHARAAAGAPKRLAAAEAKARTAGRGLWACPPPPPPAAPPSTTPPPVAPPSDPIARARADLQGRVFTRITTTTFSSTESRLNLCSDGTFVEDVETYSDFGGSTYGTYRGRWEVLAAEYRPDGSATADVRRLNDDGTIGYVTIAAAGGQVTVNGSPVSVNSSSVCS